MTGQVADLVAAGHVPQADEAAGGAGGEELAVRAERDRGHRAGVALQLDADGRRRLAGPPAGEVPEAHGPVVVAGGEGEAVGADRQVVYRAGVATGRKPFLARLGVVGPEPPLRGVNLGDEHRPPVQAEVEEGVAAAGPKLAGGYRFPGRHVPAREG